MADIVPPKPVRLDLALFPAASWARALVSAVNQFALQVVDAFKIAAAKEKELSFKTGEDTVLSFPISFPVEAIPREVRVAAVPNGDTGYSAITVKWQPVTTNGSQRAVRVNFITGLNANTSYVIRLVYL